MVQVRMKRAAGERPLVCGNQKAPKRKSKKVQEAQVAALDIIFRRMAVD